MGHIVAMDSRDSYFYPQKDFWEKENSEDKTLEQYERELKGYTKEIMADLFDGFVSAEDKNTECYKILITCFKLLEENRELSMALSKLSKLHENQYRPSRN